MLVIVMHDGESACFDHFTSIEDVIDMFTGSYMFGTEEERIIPQDQYDSITIVRWRHDHWEIIHLLGIREPI